MHHGLAECVAPPLRLRIQGKEVGDSCQVAHFSVRRWPSFAIVSGAAVCDMRLCVSYWESRGLGSWVDCVCDGGQQFPCATLSV